MVPKSAFWSELSQYRQLADIDEFGRRYLAINAFDGILTLIGVLMGTYVAGVREAYIVLSTGLVTCMAMGVSGFSGAFMAESAERKHELQELEHAMLRNLASSQQARASRFAVIAVSIINGSAPLVAGLLVMLPFMLTGIWGDVQFSYAASLAIALIALFGLGVMLARVAHENIVRSGIRMLAAGLICVILSFLLSTRGGM
jgi:predicted membrane protein (TIGR00267 family)